MVAVVHLILIVPLVAWTGSRAERHAAARVLAVDL
jgi:hypothetical protein